MPNDVLLKLKQLYKQEFFPSTREKIADEMSTYGSESISYLIECAEGEVVPANREYILEKIKQAKFTK